ncbi:hypothetical protein ABZP36_016486 [Zizania latifolia]
MGLPSRTSPPLRPRAPPRTTPPPVAGATAPRLRFLPRLASAAAPIVIAWALALPGPSIGGRYLRAGGEARDLHGGRAALRARARHGVAVRALADRPPPETPKRNHPLMLLSGVVTNAIGFDLSRCLLWNAAVYHSTTYPLSSLASYILSLLRSQISSKDMMDPELLSKLILNNFCMVPAKVLLQLTTAFRDGGLCNRGGTFLFMQHLHKINDLICPPEATVKSIPQPLVTYKVFGKPEGPHYAHYDLVGGRKNSNKPLHKCTIVIQCRN